MSNEEKYINKMEELCNSMKNELEFCLVLSILTMALFKAAKYYGLKLNVLINAIKLCYEKNDIDE